LHQRNIRFWLMKAFHLIRARVIARERGKLAAREVIVAKQSADATSPSKSDSPASKSHELSLNAISGFAQPSGQIEVAPSHEQRPRYPDNIVEANSDPGQIIDDVLDIAGIGSSHVNVNCEVLDCLEVMTEVSRILEVSARKNGILLTIDTSGNLPSIIADRGRLIQVLLNLGSNAIEFNVKSGWVLLTAIPQDGTVRFVIRDTGKGIAAERQREIFQPFKRLGAEPGDEEGTGVGLTISRRLMQAMNGTIGFESTLGEGSKFWVELPVASELAAKAACIPSLFTIATDTRGTVLYIEDKIPNVELMRAIIEDLGNTRFIDAQTVKQGLDIARLVRLDLVITDIHLPDGKGFDVLQALRNDRRTMHIPVIALTADAMSNNLHNMELAGFNHVLTKPFEVQDLMDVVEARLKAA
jgi:CheY-like chemotaxis protein